jgi:hypothetical protein
VGRDARGVASGLACAAVPLLDTVVPEYEVWERHSVALPVSPERALEVALASPAAPDWIVRTLLRLRGLGVPSGSLERFATTAPFRELGRTETELVAGILSSRLRIAFDLRAEPHAGGSLLTTETRVHALTPRARRLFRLYWLVVGPFSALIRRRWLRAIAMNSRA